MKNITIISIVIFLILPTGLYSVDYTSLYNRAVSLAKDGDYETSLILLDEIESYVVLNDLKLLLTVKIARGVIYKRMNNFKKSLNEYKDALILYESEGIDDLEKLANFYQNYAVLNSTLGNDIAAIEYFKKAIDIAIGTENIEELVRSKINLASCRIDLGQGLEVIPYLLEIERQVDSELPNYDKKHLFNNLVYAFIEGNNLRDAKIYLEKLNDIENISKDYDVFIPFQINQAAIRDREGDTEGALNLLNRAEKSCDNIFYKNILILENSKIYASLGSFELAKKTLASAENYFKSINHAQHQIEIFNIRSQYPELLDINDVAYYCNIQDSLIKIDKAVLLESITINDELKEAVKTIEAESKYKSIIITVGIALLFVLISTVIVVNRQFKVKKMTEENFDLHFSINDIYFIFDKYFANSLAKLQRYLIINKEVDRDVLLEICNEMTINAFKLKENENEYISK